MITRIQIDSSVGHAKGAISALIGWLATEATQPISGGEA
jgi:hypothetical protein